MTTAYESPGFAAAERASLRAPEDGFLTTAQTNAIQAALEDRAEQEISSCARMFCEWIAESEHGPSIARAVVYWPVAIVNGRWMTRKETLDKREDNLAEAVERMRQDYVAYRVATFTDDERAEVEREVMRG